MTTYPGGPFNGEPTQVVNIIYEFRRGLSAEWTLKNSLLRQGEPGVELDTGRFKIGDGITLWRDLPYHWRDLSNTQVFAQAGMLSPIVGAAKLPIHGGTYEILGVAISLGTLPDTDAVTVDVNKNGVTIFTNQTNRPSIAADGGFIDESGIPDIVSITTGDYLTVDIDDVGTGSASDLVVSIRMLQVS